MTESEGELSDITGNANNENMSSTSKRQTRAATPVYTDDEDIDYEYKKIRVEDDDRKVISKLKGLRPAEKPAELFRKDLISAMKLADTESLDTENYYQISDTWRQEWETGVQVPVNPDIIREIEVTPFPERKELQGNYSFKLPRKFLHASKDVTFCQGTHELHDTQQLADQVCRYDLDFMDVQWLQEVNYLMEDMGLLPIEEWEMEKIMEDLETKCYDNMQNMIKTVEGLGIEYDENVTCDVCRSPEGEDTNEIVFCDKCDICVHQACYGITTIPAGNWLCRTCALGIRPVCILCPNTGGAMKSTKSGTKWAHVSCALWIPEVIIGCPEKMEPIQNISFIPVSRWSLTCSVCRERAGACIQCSVKTCKTAFHVTCAFQDGYDMKTVFEDEHEEIQLKGYCAKHSSNKRHSEAGVPLTPTKRPSEMTEAEKKEARSDKLRQLAEEFYTCVTAAEITESLKMCDQHVEFVYNYWVLKRKSLYSVALLTPKTEEADLLSKQEEESIIARMKMFVHLRQDLERVRNLSYMVSRREKVRRSLYHMKEQIFLRQLSIARQLEPHELHTRPFEAVLDAHKSGDSVYDNVRGILDMAERSDLPEGSSFHFDHRLEGVKLHSRKRTSATPGSARLSIVLKHRAAMKSGNSAASNEYLQKRKMRHSLHSFAQRKHEKVNGIANKQRPRSTGALLRGGSLSRVPKPSQRMHEIQSQQAEKNASSKTEDAPQSGDKDPELCNTDVLAVDPIAASTPACTPASGSISECLRSITDSVPQTKSALPTIEKSAIDSADRTQRYNNRLKRMNAAEAEDEETDEEQQQETDEETDKDAPPADSTDEHPAVTGVISACASSSIKKSLHDIGAKIKNVTPPKTLLASPNKDKQSCADEVLPSTPTSANKSDPARNLFDSLNSDFSVEKKGNVGSENPNNAEGDSVDTVISTRTSKNCKRTIPRQLFEVKLEAARFSNGEPRSGRSTRASSPRIDSPMEIDNESVSSDKTIQADEIIKVAEPVVESNNVIKPCSLLVDKSICKKVVQRMAKLRQLQSENVTRIVTTDKHTDAINGVSDITRTTRSKNSENQAPDKRRRSEPPMTEQRVLRRLNVELSPANSIQDGLDGADDKKTSDNANRSPGIKTVIRLSPGGKGSPSIGTVIRTSGTKKHSRKKEDLKLKPKLKSPDLLSKSRYAKHQRHSLPMSTTKVNGSDSGIMLRITRARDRSMTPTLNGTGDGKDTDDISLKSDSSSKSSRTLRRSLRSDIPAVDVIQGIPGKCRNPDDDAISVNSAASSGSRYSIRSRLSDH